MDSTPVLPDSSRPTGVTRGMGVLAAQGHVELESAAADMHMGPVSNSDCQPCTALLPSNASNNREQPLTAESGRGWSLLLGMGSAQNVGLLYMAIYALNLALMGMFVKLAGKAGLSTWEIVCARALMLASVCVLQLAHARARPWGSRILMLHVRGALGMVALTSLFFSMVYLPVADAIVFTFLAPLIILVASPYVLGETTGSQWLPLLLATTGVVLICQPSFLFGRARLSLLGVMFGCVHAAASAAAKMILRALKEEHTAVKILYLATYCVAVSASVMVVDGRQWTLPDVPQALLLVCCGLTGLGMQFFLTMGLERVEASLGMGVTYTAIIWSELVGVTVFHEIPNAWAIVGTAVVLYSTLHNSLVQAVASTAQADSQESTGPQSPRSEIEESLLLLKPEP